MAILDHYKKPIDLNKECMSAKSHFILDKSSRRIKNLIQIPSICYIVNVVVKSTNIS